jgi:hypothetical protein
VKEYPSNDLPADYGEYTDAIVADTNADAVAVLVLGGSRGNGACPAIKLNATLPPEQVKALLVAALRALASGIEGTPLPVPAECAINVTVRDRGASN